MKKQNAGILTLAVIVGFLLCFSGCGLGAKTGSQTKSDGGSQTANNSASGKNGNDSSADKSKTGGSLADDIVGKWEEKEHHERLIFGKDGNIIVDNGEGDHGKATYSIIDAETIEIKEPSAPNGVRMKIKINGDTMQMTGGPRGETTFKRVS